MMMGMAVISAVARPLPLVRRSGDNAALLRPSFRADSFVLPFAIILSRVEASFQSAARFEHEEKND